VGTKVDALSPGAAVDPLMSCNCYDEKNCDDQSSPARRSLFAHDSAASHLAAPFSSVSAASSSEVEDAASHKPPLAMGSREYKKLKRDLEEAAKQARKDLELDVGRALLEVKELAVQHANALYKSLTAHVGVRSREKKDAGAAAMVAKEEMINDQSGPIMDAMEAALQRIEDELKASLAALLVQAVPPTASSANPGGLARKAEATREAEKATRNGSPMGVGDRRSADLEVSSL